MPSFLAAAVAAVPPVVLLAITHLTVLLIRTPATTETAESTETSAIQTSPQDSAMTLRDAGWSNKAIARELNVHPSTVGRWFASIPLTAEGLMPAPATTSEEEPK